MDSVQSNPGIFVFSSEHFPQSNAAAESSVALSRRRRAGQGEVLSTDWDQDDLLLALRSRLGPLRILGNELLKAAISTHSALWPESEGIKNIEALAEALRGSKQRLREWRHSSARAGADEALSWVLSWYEQINLDALAELRATSSWVTDPALVRRRQERAFAIAKWADSREYIPGDDDSEDEEEEEADSDHEYADSGATRDAEEEAVDEEIQMEAAPQSTNTESGTQVNPQTVVTEPRADANAPVIEPAAATQASAPEPRVEAQDTAPETQPGTTESGTISIDESLRLAAEIAADAASVLAASNPTIAP